MKITFNIYNIKMSSEFSQGAYFQPNQDGAKGRSSRKRTYKYTEEEYGHEPPATDRYRPFENRYNVNDFSFEDRTEKLRTPKREPILASKKDEGLSPIAGNDSSKKKDFDLRINKIENLNDKISSLLKMVPRGSTIQAQDRSSRLKQLPREIKLSAKKQNIQTRLDGELPIQCSPYHQIQQQTKRNRRIDERKRNFSYLEQQSDMKTKKYGEMQQQFTKRYNVETVTDPEQQSSPISKYRKQVFEQIPKEPQPLEEKQSKTLEISESILKVNTEAEKNPFEARYKYNNTSTLLQKYREQSKIKQKERQSYVNKENEELEKKERVFLNNVELDLKINEVRNRIIQESPLKLKNVNVSENQYRSRVQDYYNTDEIGDQPTLQKMALKLSFLVDLDIIQRKIRHSFQQFKNEKKWEMLRAQLKALGMYRDQKQLKQVMKISIHQKNPFGDKIESLPLNGQKDLAKLFAQTEKIWSEQLQKCISLDDLALQDFEMGLIDLNRKGYISIEDLVCFINVNGQKFYRSRDLAQLFRRFLKIQGKNLDKNINDGIGYKTFMGKLCK